jgi:hypothetical protein
MEKEMLDWLNEASLDPNNKQAHWLGAMYLAIQFAQDQALMAAIDEFAEKHVELAKPHK